MILAPPNLRIALLLGALNAGTIATADFSATYPGGSLQFGITVTVHSVSLSAVIHPDGDDANQLTVTFNSIDFQVPNLSALQIALSDQSGLGPAVQKVLNTAEVQQKIVSAIKGQFNDHLKPISGEVTTLIRKLMNQQLGGN
jgi:hypothetical protein